jgi:hypothetical protein
LAPSFSNMFVPKLGWGNRTFKDQTVAKRDIKKNTVIQNG